MVEKNEYSVIVLAGGNSSRMNFPKPWLKLPNGMSFLSQIVRQYSECGFQNILVVINDDFCSEEWRIEVDEVKKYAQIIPNTKVERGRLYSLKLGIKKLSNSLFVFVHNVDNPFVQKSSLFLLKEHQNNGGYTVPTFQNKGGHPILISQDVQQSIVKNKTIENLRELLSDFKRTNVAVKDENILRNINTPVDYKTVISEFI